MKNALQKLVRPQPPEAFSKPGELFAPAQDVFEWIGRVFIDKSAPLRNTEHAHLQKAEIAVLWTNVPYARKMRTVVGTAEIPTFRGSAWQKERQQQQLRDWFGFKPDFLITLFGPYMARASNAEYCAVIEHELYHCGQAKDDYNCPKWKRNGKPVFGIRGHDIEEFIGVARRYGVAAVGAREFLKALKARPLISARRMTGVCGTCEAQFV